MNLLAQLCIVSCSVFIGANCQYNTGYNDNNYYSAQRRKVNNYPQLQKRSEACPEANGTFPTNTCDGYVQCVNGVAEEKLCPDGLLFNAEAGYRSFPCQYPIDVDCTGREQTQPPQSTDDCPHQFGYFKVGDQNNCGQFKNCVDGRGFIFDCPEGLAWNSATYRCDWPDQVTDCNAEEYLGFTCPPDAKEYGLGQEEFRYFRSTKDCQHYYICIDSKPRLYNCGDGKAFNEATNTCEDSESVAGCAVPELDDDRIRKLVRFSNQEAQNKFRF